MKNNLFENLRALRAIKPDSEYAKKSRGLILSAELRLPAGGQETVRYDVAFWMKTGIAVSFAFLIMLGGLFVGRAMYERVMVAQANETNEKIQIRLNEIKYLLSDPARASQEKISQSMELLQNAANELQEADVYLYVGNVGESLKGINAAQNLLVEIESIISQ